MAELVDQSHYHVMVLACASCGQHFVSVFTESIDWADGDDPQYWQLLPITATESESLRAGDEPEESVLNALGPGRRCLHFAHPKGMEGRAFFGTGLHVGLWDPLESTCRHASLSIL